MLNKYPLWKNLLLLFILLIGFFYALPNAFGEDPAVQVSPPTGSTINSVIIDKVQNALQIAGLRVKAVQQSGSELLVRFSDTDTQLKAREIIKAALGDDYTVAINLAPATPSWLMALGAQPMKLGLDLRGGIHFAYEIDVDSIVTQRLAGIVKGSGDLLRKDGIRYAAIIQQQNQILWGFRDQDSLSNALPILQRQYPELQFSQRNIGDRFQLIATWSAQSLNDLRQQAIDKTMMTLRNRINELGVAEPVVQQQGANRIAVDLPGVQDTARAQQVLGGTATLEFRLVDTIHDARVAASSGSVLPGARLYQLHGQPILLQNQIILTGNSITNANASMGEDGRPSVEISLGGGGENYFHRVTGENIGKPLAIVYVETKMQNQMVNGKVVVTPKKIERVISAPTIESALPPNFQITGLTDQLESQNLALLLRSGALPAAIYMVEERTIGPQLGAENIHMGVLSIAGGFVLAVIFMALYYNVFGLIADLALTINLILLVAVLSLLGATLTLPGMAGMLLTLAMSVDANVLIFQRIREELHNGASPQASINAGYERALGTIIDTNITTLIAALVLFGIGTGPLKNFAITLSLGLLTSMLSAIMFTRALVNAFYGGRTVKQLPIGI